MIGLNAQNESHDVEVVDEEDAEHGVEAEDVVGEAEADDAADERDVVALAGGGCEDSMDLLMEEMACVGVQQEGPVVRTCGPYRHNAAL